MNRGQAKRLIENTFESPFDKSKFIVFIKNLLNNIDEIKAFHARGYVKQSFKQMSHIIKTYERIGTYTDPSDKKIDILIVYLEEEASLNRARTTMRNFVAKYLKDRGKKNAALVAYVSPDEEDWRFSLVKMDYRFKETLSGTPKPKEEFTPARRWSFLVGKNERSHTAQSRLVPILEDDEHNPTLKELEEAFNIEPVTKEFFEKYRVLLIRIVDELDKIVKKDEKVKKDFQQKNINTIDFAKKLLGQIVFLYFLQKKGWFGVPQDKKWGEGDKNFLRTLFKKYERERKNFFNDYLEELFYNALNNPRTDQVDPTWSKYFNCKIPFLNGGLFETIGNYDWVNTEIPLPNELFSNKNDTYEGDGILDIFDLFNFTVKEDEPLEKEVAIDPELLGKLYEKFNAIRPDNFYEYREALLSGKKTLEKKFNKAFGVYYTPREIVHYMCQQSLINYLSTFVNHELEKIPVRPTRQLKIAGAKEPGQLRFRTEKELVSKQDFEILIKYGELFAENEATVKDKGKETRTYKYQLPESIRKNAKLIDDKLKEVKVCDPALGSGAFLVGMMHEITKARNVLSVFINEDGRTKYKFKRECIEKSLYGVDIDSGACEVAKLRLWLSLVVDEDDIENVKPLPNLDYKIVCGNSLLGFPENWGSPIEKEIEALMDKYFSITNPERKRVLKTKIDEKIKSRYAASEKNFGYKINFDFKIIFSKVFREKGGFDIVIANPPYVRHERIKDQKNSFSKAGYEVYNSTSDLYTYFYERSWKILEPYGFSCFISSNKWMRAKYGEKLRRFFKNKAEVISLIDFGGYPVFEANVDTNIILFKKKQPDKTHKVEFVNVESKFGGKDLISFVEENQKTILQEKLNYNGWSLADEKILGLKEKIEKIGTPLKDWDVKICFGIKTGFNKAFIIDNKTKERLCKEDPKSAEVLKPILRGRDIGRYYYEWAGLWVIATFPSLNLNINDYPAVSNYLKQFGKRLEQSGKPGCRKKTDHKWFETQDNIAYYPEFEKEKIVWQEIVREPSFTYDSGKLYCEATSFLMTGKSLKYLIAILNSKPVAFFFKQFYAGGGLGEEGYRYKKAFLEQLPIPKIPGSEQRPFIELVDKILSLTQSPDFHENLQKQAKVKKYEHQIDQMVYELYELTEEEIKIVEKL